jgi:hypothetical protein
MPEHQIDDDPSKGSYPDVSELIAEIQPSAEVLAPSDEFLGLTGGQLRALAIVNSLAGEVGYAVYESTQDSDLSSRRRVELAEQLTTAIRANDQAEVARVISGLDDPDMKSAKALVAALESNESPAGALRAHQADDDFTAWLSQSSLPRQSGIPTAEGSYLLPAIGARAFVSPEAGALTVEVKLYDDSPQKDLLRIPLGDHELEWIDWHEIYGSSREAMASQLEVFGAIAAHTDTVYTHVRATTFVPALLQSEAWGSTRLRGADAAARNLIGLDAEKGTLGDPDKYETAAERLRAGQRPGRSPIKNNDGKGSIVSSIYVETGSPDAVILFDQSITEHREVLKPPAHGIVGQTRFDDPDLIGIWVAPRFRENLLAWINTWPDEEKARIFKGRGPESILISKAEDIPPQFRAHDRPEALTETESAA